MLLQRIDHFLLDNLCQKFADRFQEMMGKSCFWLAKVCHMPFPLMVILLWARGVSVAPVSLDLVVIFFSVLQVIAWDRADRQSSSYLRAGVLNPAREFFPRGLIRIMLLVIIGGICIGSAVHRLIAGQFLWYQFPVAVVLFLWVASFYFGACTPKPPSVLRAGNKLAVAT